MSSSDNHVFSDHAPLVLASRVSPLACIQAEEVKARLAPVTASIATFSTRGDEVLDRPLADIGGKGLFVKYLEQVMLEGKADAAVHSGKDMEAILASGTELAAILPRADRRDALVGAYGSLDDLPQGAVIGTASARRAALLLARRPDITPKLLRGSVNSRLNALKNGQYDAIILAMAGLKRLGITDDVHPLTEDAMLPSAAQGAIIVQAKSIDGEMDRIRRQAVLDAIHGINDAVTASEVMAERAFLASLDGSCRSPIAASATRADDQIRFCGQICSPDGQKHFADTVTVAVGDAIDAAQDMAIRLLERAGGRSFMTIEDIA
jgi:hydroxymethylbilane synthase